MQAMLERDIQGTLRSWQAHLEAAALIFVQARADLPLAQNLVQASSRRVLSNGPWFAVALPHDGQTWRVLELLTHAVSWAQIKMLRRALAAMTRGLCPAAIRTTRTHDALCMTCAWFTSGAGHQRGRDLWRRCAPAFARRPAHSPGALPHAPANLCGGQARGAHATECLRGCTACGGTPARSCFGGAPEGRCCRLEEQVELLEARGAHTCWPQRRCAAPICCTARRPV